MKSSTITNRSEPQRTSGARLRTSLVVLCDADRPTASSSSHLLDGVDEVVFRRGARGALRKARSLTITLPDRRMSSEHGRLIRGVAGWVLDDPTSKNGTVVDGTVSRRAMLRDRAVLELGRTFLMLRQVEADGAPAHLDGDVDAAQLPDWPRGLATFAPALARDFEALMRLAPSAVPIIVLGETGTGKEVVARAIHAASARRGELVAVNCGALPEGLLEAELFGHRRGAFPGAEERAGLIRAADRGTLFLDEVDELHGSSQVALLRVLQEREVLPIGADRPVTVDVRVIAAALQSLDTNADFRPDLNARLAGHIVLLPPLQERPEDLGLLIATLLAGMQRGREVRISPVALRAMLRNRWRGNVRELEQVLTTAVALAPDEHIELEHLPVAVRASSPSSPSPPPAELDEEDQRLRERLVATLAKHDGNVVAVAKALGRKRTQIYKWIKRLAIDLDAFRPE